ELEKGHAQLAGEAAAEGALARAAQSEEGDHGYCGLRRLGGGEKRRGPGAESAREQREVLHGDVAFARLHLHEEPRAEPGARRELPQGEAALGAELSGPPTQSREKGAPAHVGTIIPTMPNCQAV